MGISSGIWKCAGQMEITMSGARFGYRWMVSPDGGNARWVKQEEVSTRYAAWADCDDMSDAEVMKLMERRWFGARNNKQQLAA